MSGVLRPGSQAGTDRTGIAAADGAQVNSSVVGVSGGEALWAELEITVTGGPSGLEVRAALEGSADGTNWHQIVRFKDKTAAAVQLARVSSNAAGSIADLAAAALGSASVGGSVTDGPLPGMVRLVTKVQTLSGGAAPTVDIHLRLAVSG